MDFRCEYSRLTIPNDPSYAGIAGKFVANVAEKIGFDTDEIRTIDRGMEKALANVMEYSFEPGELTMFDVECERVPEGIRIVIRDRGLPFDPSLYIPEGSTAQSRGDSESAAGLKKLKEYMDEVEFHNLGKEGKETVLIKHLRNKSITDYYDACDLEPFLKPWEGRKPEGRHIDFTVRPMEPSEAVEVSRCIYKAYGYSYGYEHVYYPERLIELNRTGRLLSVVAVTDDNVIAGHCALIYRYEGARIAEMGQGVVKPEFRASGCLTQLTEYILSQARAEGLTAIYGQAVTNHTYSQRVGHRLGLADCAIVLCHVPQSVTFKGISDNLSHRVSVVIHCMYLHKPEITEVYAPPHHEDMIRRLYAELGAEIRLMRNEDSDAVDVPGESTVSVKVTGTLNYAAIEVEQYGSDVVREVHKTLRELKLKRLDVINLFLDLGNPRTYDLTSEFESLGFFFAGILPAAFPRGDALILQYLNNVEADYDDIQTAGDSARELVSYIRSHDPNQIPQ